MRRGRRDEYSERIRMVHLMVAGRGRDDDLALSANVSTDTSDLSPDRRETHIVLPPTDMAGNISPIPGARHGFLHLMFEEVDLVL